MAGVREDSNLQMAFCHPTEISDEFAWNCLTSPASLRQFIGCSTNRLLEVRILSAQPLQHRRWKVWPVFSIPTGPAHLRQIAQRQAAIKIAPSLTSQREKAQKTIRRYVVEVER